MGLSREVLSLRWSTLTRAPSRIYNFESPLTGAPSGGLQGGPSKEIAIDFLNENLSLFGLDPDDIAETRISRELVTQYNGLLSITIQQQVNGLDVFEATFMANVDRNGQIQNISSSLMPKIRNSVNTTTPQITPDEAIMKAAQSAMVILMQNTEVKGLVYFPFAIGKTHLAYEVIVGDGQTPNIYRSVVDAVDGTILWRKNMVAYAHGSVFTGDSPVPNTPIGSSIGEVPRVDMPFSGLGAFPAADPHFDWWNGSGEPNRTRSISNNIQVRDQVTNNYAIGTISEAFNFPLSFPYDTTVNPNTYTNASITNVFYWLNRLHDMLYNWGFDESANNYQNTKFFVPSPNPRVDVHVQHPGEGCNAHSGGPWINFGMCAPSGIDCWGAGPFNCRDIAFEAPIFAHEFGHSIHFALMTLSGAQYMGEGYADVFAITAFAEPGDDLFGSYPVGQWSFNNVNGIRRAPYSTDQTVFPYTYGTIKNTPGEIYPIGEVWCNTVWMARANMVWKYGFQTGHPTMMKLVVDGMKLAPANPDFLDLRDAILLSDRINNAGVNQCILWDAFAKMGLGWSAKSMGADDAAPLEAFNTPPTCTPNISVNGSLDLGSVCPSEAMTKQLEIFNTGTGDLIVKKISRLSGSTDITVDANPTRPVFVSQGAHVDFTVRCTPTSVGAKTATIRIESNDADQPAIDLTATCTGSTTGTIKVTGSTTFGDACAGTVSEKTVSVCNVGECTLNVTSASFVPPCADFTIINNPFPTKVSHDSCNNITIRFTPTSAGPKTCTLVINSDDPITPSVTLQVTANTPTGSLINAASLFFNPTVNKIAGVCQSKQTLPISNAANCGTNVTNVTLSGTDATSYSLSGVPVLPFSLSPGETLGDGNLAAVLKPTKIHRDLNAQVDVTYETDPILHTTAIVTGPMCGEGVTTGVRILVTHNGIPYPSVKRITLSGPSTFVIKNEVKLVSVTPLAPCQPVQYHVEYGTASNTKQLKPGTYRVTVMDNNWRTRYVNFTLKNVCDFNPNIVVDFP